MMKNLLIPLGKILLLILICLSLIEIAVRLMIKTETDGQQYFMDGRIQPLRLPVTAMAEILQAYRDNPTSYTQYDEDLGWTIRPNSTSGDGANRSNSAGMRSDREFELMPTPGVLRIATLGDSHTHGDDCKVEHTWPYRLPSLLGERGITAEVLNFGVGGYGMDQALLRWRKDAHLYKPDVVIFGFAPSNLARNVNLFRCVMHNGTGIPFSKPRFVLDGGELRLINSPTVALGEIESTLADFKQWPHREYEFHFSEESYAPRWWLSSRWFAVALKAIRRRPVRIPCRGLTEEPAQLALAIVRTFAEEVESSGSRFIVLHLPQERSLDTYRDTGRFCYEEILDRLDERHELVRTEGGFDPADFSQYFEILHFGPEGHEVTAVAAADHLARDHCRIR